jgi:GT2 family glycosyltransferase
MVSAVILSYNRCHEVLKTIDKLKAIQPTLPFSLEIVVVDNASADDTSLQVKQLHSDVVLVTKPKNNGIAGWNEGFKVAKNKYFLVLDDDSHIHSGLTEAVNRMESHPDIGILAMQIVDESLQVDPNLDLDEAWKDNEEIAGFIGCGAIIRKEVYDKIGGFAEWIYVYTHEFEYSVRCHNAGYRIVFFANGIVVHRVSKVYRSVERLRIYSTRNELGIVYKFFRSEKYKYLYRVVINNLKFAKREGLKSAYYVLLGTFRFLSFKSQLELTPVSQKTQNYFSEKFWSTQPILKNLKRRFSSKA